MHKKICLFLGFILVANFYLIPSHEMTPRATDLIGILITLWLFFYFLRHGISIIPLAIIMVLSLFPLNGIIIGYEIGDLPLIILSIRWLLALPWAYMLYMITSTPNSRYTFVYGMIYGIILNLLVMVLQAFGAGDILQEIGLTALDSKWNFVYGVIRVPGLHGQENASMAVVSLIIPLCMYLFYEHYSKGKWLIILGIFVVGLGTSLTLTRSPAIISVIVLISIILFNFHFKGSMKLIFLLLIIFLVGLGSFGPPGGWKRWNDIDNIKVNSVERVTTNVSSLRLALNNPLGIGEIQKKELIGVTHNAFLQVSLEYGVLMGLIIFIALIIMALRALQGGRGSFALSSMFALHIVGLFLFEEHLNNPTFIILTVWLVISAGVRFFSFRRESKAKVHIQEGYV